MGLSYRAAVRVLAAGISMTFCGAIFAAGDAPATSGKPSVKIQSDHENPADGAAIAGLFDLTGQSGLPEYLKAGSGTIATAAGVNRGEIRTIDTDFFGKDFVLDVVFEFPASEKHETGRVGIGEGGRDAFRGPESIGVELKGNGAEGGTTSFGARARPRSGQTVKLSTAGPHLLRMEKKGDKLQFFIVKNFTGKLTAEPCGTVPSFRTLASKMNRLNSGLFFGGEVLFKAVRLEVDGKAVDPGAAKPAVQEISGAEGLMKFGKGSGMPAYFAPDVKSLNGADGLEIKEHDFIHTRDVDFIDRDFTLDVIYHFKPDQRNEMRIGIGKNEDLDHAIVAKIGGPIVDGRLSFGGFEEKLSRDHAAGPNMVRLQKRGNTLTFAICADYKGKFVPDYAATIPDLRHAAPSLTGENSSLFIGDGGCIDQTRLVAQHGTAEKTKGSVVAAPAQGSGTPPVSETAPRKPNVGPNIIPIGESRALPKAFRASKDVVTASDGLRDRFISTAESIAFRDDFTLDVLFRFNEKNGELRAGIGNGTDDPSPSGPSMVIKAYGPDHSKHLGICRPGKPQVVVDALSGAMGPHLLRIEKKGECLTLSLMENYNDRFDPGIVKTIPDLSAFAPFLKGANWLFCGGDEVTIMGLGLSVNGKPFSGGTASGTVPERNSTEKKQPETVSQPVEGPAWTLDKENGIALESNDHVLAPGFAGSLLLVEGEQLRRLGPDGFSVRETLKMPNAYRWIAERRDCFVAMSDKTKSLDIIDKPSMRVRKSIQMAYFRRNDLCINPWKPISYVTVEKSTGDGMLKAILIVNEETGDVREPDNFIGTWVQLSPDGRTLYSAYKDIYEKGSRLLFNPDRIDLIPEYGNIDMILEYDVSGMTPRFLRIQKQAGANGQGLVLSADGARLSYLSFVGYPLYSKDISAWAPGDLALRPVLYPTKDNKCDCKHLAFHPWLPIAAACGDGIADGAVCFDRESGQVQAGRILPHSSLASVKINDVRFSPDGHNLILDCEEKGHHYLLRLKLKLSDEEQKRLGDPKQVRPPVEPGGAGTTGTRT